MKKYFGKLYLGGVLLISLSMSLTSCEGALDDILGEWSRPTPGSSTGGAVTSIDLDADEMKLAAGDKGQLTAKVDPAGTAVTWSSDQEEVATVDANGLVTAVAVGTAIITAKAGDKKATCTVTVTPGLATPLTLEAITAGTIVVSKPRPGMKYSLNGGVKTAVTATPINVAIGDKVAFYGNGTSITSYYASSSDYTNIAGGDAEVKVYGNIMSLVDETGFATNIKLPAENTFRMLFNGNAKLTDASGLLLPATTLADNCYYSMFLGCTSLTTAPELPATTLNSYCYAAMFNGCSSLTTAPELKAETLVGDCYNSMFANCSNLSSVTCLATDISASYCTSNWLLNVAATGTFIKAASMTRNGSTIQTATNYPENADGIPSGWTTANYVEP